MILGQILCIVMDRLTEMEMIGKDIGSQTPLMTPCSSVTPWVK